MINSIRSRYFLPGVHARDEDCYVDADTSLCSVCGVYHGDPCPDCGGRGFHRDGCPTVQAIHEQADLERERLAEEGPDELDAAEAYAEQRRESLEPEAPA